MCSFIFICISIILFVLLDAFVNKSILKTDESMERKDIRYIFNRLSTGKPTMPETTQTTPIYTEAVKVIIYPNVSRSESIGVITRILSGDCGIKETDKPSTVLTKFLVCFIIFILAIILISLGIAVNSYFNTHIPPFLTSLFPQRYTPANTTDIELNNKYKKNANGRDRQDAKAK